MRLTISVISLFTKNVSKILNISSYVKFENIQNSIRMKFNLKAKHSNFKLKKAFKLINLQCIIKFRYNIEPMMKIYILYRILSFER